MNWEKNMEKLVGSLAGASFFVFSDLLPPVFLAGASVDLLHHRDADEKADYTRVSP
jgi:hypothetical protein